MLAINNIEKRGEMTRLSWSCNVSEKGVSDRETSKVKDAELEPSWACLWERPVWLGV